MHPLIPYFRDTPLVVPFIGLELHWFGVLVAAGFVLGGNVAQAKATKFGGSADAINRLIGWLVFGVFVGGHWGHLLMYKPEEIAGDGAKFSTMLSIFASGRVPHGDEVPVTLQFWHGLSSFGGFFVCVPLTIWFFRREKMPFWPNADALAIGFSLGWFFGRMGCFSAHDHAGTPTEFWLGVYGMCPGNNPTVACHDLGLYEAIWSLGAYGLFLLLDRTPRTPGFYTGLLGALYGPCRFFSDFFRPTETDTRYLGLTPAQYGSLLLAGLGVWILRGRLAAPAAPPSVDGNALEEGAQA